MILEILITAVVASVSAGFLTAHRFRKKISQLMIQTSDSIERSNEKILSSEAERDRLLDALSDAFLLVDQSASIRFANRAAQDLFGSRQILDRPVTEAFLEPRLTGSIVKCLQTGESTSQQVILPQQSSPRGEHEARGTSAWVVDTAMMPTPEGKERMARVILRDITDSYQAEQIRKDFVANASHELRTPLAIINGYLENLLEENGTGDPEMSRRFLSIMQKHTDRISRIVEDMLVISRLESGEAAALKIEPFRLQSCIQDVLERLESVIRSQQAEVTLTLDDKDIVIQGDRFYWTQVLFNLVENALKQNPQTRLKVEIGCGKIENEKLRIWVADNGIGIPAADLPHIFRRFYRVEKHHSQREIKGTGLGLSIVKRAIEAHGGTIRVTSTPGRDTRFLIEV
jgi:two-component system, OmpR family, phosphate regulon sensor histidine kinase PhoR